MLAPGATHRGQQHRPQTHTQTQHLQDSISFNGYTCDSPAADNMCYAYASPYYVRFFSIFMSLIMIWKKLTTKAASVKKANANLKKRFWV